MIGSFKHKALEKLYTDCGLPLKRDENYETINNEKSIPPGKTD